MIGTPYPRPTMTRLLPLLVLLGCTGDIKLDAIEVPPTVEIQSPGDGTVFARPGEIPLQGRVRDADGTHDDLLVTWQVDGVSACAGVEPDQDGDVSCAATVPSGSVVISLRASDPDGGEAEDTITIEVGEDRPPTIDWSLPAIDTELHVDTPFALSALVTDDLDAADAITLDWSSSRSEDDLSALPSSPDSSGSVAGFLTLSEGSRSLTLEARDSQGQLTRETRLLEVEAPNAVPTCSWSFPIDDAVLPAETLPTFEASASDADGDATALTWRIDSDQDGPLAAGSPSSVGHIDWTPDVLGSGTHLLTLEVADVDGGVCTDTVAVRVDYAPALFVLTPAPDSRIDLGTPVVLEAEATDPDDIGPDLTVVWTSDSGLPLSIGSPDLTGMLTLSSSALPRGEHGWTATVSDPAGRTDVASGSLLINGPPTAPVVSISPSTPDTLADLTATVVTPSTDLEGDDITYEITWSNGSDTAVGASVTSEMTSAGDTWTATVVASDGSLQGPPATASVQIGGRPVTIDSAELRPTNPVTCDTLFVSLQLDDPDDDALPPSYRWIWNGAVAADGTDPQLAQAIRGDTVQVIVTVTDATGPADTWTSPVVTIGNAPPSLTAAVISPADPTPSEGLSCQGAGWFDAEGDPDRQHITWIVDGVTLPPQGDSLARGQMGPGSIVQCVATPYDDYDEGVAVFSEAVTTPNAAPTCQIYEPAPGAILAAERDWTFDADADDPDHLPDDLSWQLSAPGVGILRTGTIGDGIYRQMPGLPLGTHLLTFTVTDPVGETCTHTVSVDVHAAPEITVVLPAGLSRPNLGEALQFEAIVTDADDASEDLLVTLELRANGPSGTAVPEPNGDVQLALTMNVAADLRWFATVEDPTGLSTTVRGNRVLVNSPPGPFAVEISPSSPTTTDQLQAIRLSDAVDPNGDPVTYTYTWTHGTETVFGDTVAASETTVGEMWTLNAVATDGNAETSANPVSVTITSGAFPSFAGTCGAWTLVGSVPGTSTTTAKFPSWTTTDRADLYASGNINVRLQALTGTTWSRIASPPVNLDAPATLDGDVYYLMDGQVLSYSYDGIRWNEHLLLSGYGGEDPNLSSYWDHQVTLIDERMHAFAIDKIGGVTTVVDYDLAAGTLQTHVVSGLPTLFEGNAQWTLHLAYDAARRELLFAPRHTSAQPTTDKLYIIDMDTWTLVHTEPFVGWRPGYTACGDHSGHLYTRQDSGAFGWHIWDNNTRLWRTTGISALSGATFWGACGVSEDGYLYATTEPSGNAQLYRCDLQ